jgi:hypothetical protein
MQKIEKLNDGKNRQNKEPLITEREQSAKTEKRCYDGVETHGCAFLQRGIKKRIDRINRIFMIYRKRRMYYVAPFRLCNFALKETL